MHPTGTPIRSLIEDVNNIQTTLCERASRARRTARAARKRGDLRKWDKFNAIARCYEHSIEPLDLVLQQLCDLPPPDGGADDIPW